MNKKLKKEVLHYTFKLKFLHKLSRENVQICISAKNEKSARIKLKSVFGEFVVEKLVKDYAEKY